jgi:hypothetical protein
MKTPHEDQGTKSYYPGDQTYEKRQGGPGKSLTWKNINNLLYKNVEVKK